MSQHEIESIELDIKEAKELVKLGDILLRLEKNRDFQRLITDEYFVKEASRLVLAKADPNIVNTVNEALIDRDIIAIGALKQFFQRIKLQAYHAETAITENEKELEAIRNEIVE